MQTTALSDSDARLRVERGAFTAGPAHLYVTAGAFTVAGRVLDAG